ncbi:MAG: helix-turn-helix transcriptional regulator [Bacilli bacterium]|nr:helix-turn-helix transcriptional regulator [Bacilli bacterium]
MNEKNGNFIEELRFFNKFGDFIKETRISCGLTINEVALKSGFTSVEIRNIEANKNKPKVDNLRKLADALNCDYFKLFDVWEKSE